MKVVGVASRTYPAGAFVSTSSYVPSGRPVTWMIPARESVSLCAKRSQSAGELPAQSVIVHASFVVVFVSSHSDPLSSGSSPVAAAPCFARFSKVSDPAIGVLTTAL